jgi:hypothetical protein
MWLFLTVMAITGLWLMAVLLNFVPPPHAKTIIKIHNGQLRVTRGRLRAQPREFISAILKEAGVTSGFIAITYYDRVSFSQKIPNSIYQRLRNVLLNSP